MTHPTINPIFIDKHYKDPEFYDVLLKQHPVKNIKDKGGMYYLIKKEDKTFLKVNVFRDIEHNKIFAVNSKGSQIELLNLSVLREITDDKYRNSRWQETKNS